MASKEYKGRSISIKVTPTSQLIADINGMIQDVGGNSGRAALSAGGLIVASEWRRAIYAYPLVDTGTYGRSVGFEVVGRDNELICIVGTDIIEPPYPFFLEFGTSKMAPKIHVRPAVERAEAPATAAIAKTLDAMIARYG